MKHADRWEPGQGGAFKTLSEQQQTVSAGFQEAGAARGHISRRESGKVQRPDLKAASDARFIARATVELRLSPELPGGVGAALSCCQISDKVTFFFCR